MLCDRLQSVIPDHVILPILSDSPSIDDRYGRREEQREAGNVQSVVVFQSVFVISIIEKILIRMVLDLWSFYGG